MSSEEQQLKDLTSVSKQVLEDYEDILQRYNQLVGEHASTKQQLSELQSVAEPMYDEYGKIQTKYQLEKSLRYAAENYATKVVKDNNKMKRQSAMLLAQMPSTTVPISIDIDIDESNKEQEERIEQLNDIITDLQNQVAQSEQTLAAKEDDYNILSLQTDSFMAEKEEYRMKYVSLQEKLNSQGSNFLQQQRELKSLKRVSTLAYTDYTAVQEQYETEKALRIKAEAYARELQRKRDSSVEQIATNSNKDLSSDSEPMKKLVTENESLHSQLSEQETSYISQIEDLEQQLKDSTAHTTIENLEEKLEILKEDLERVNEELSTQKHQNEVLEASVTKLQKERDGFLSIPIPPPPPPPPGPPGGISRLLVIGKKKKREQKLQKVVGKDVGKKDPMQGAIQEMMNRIRTGGAGLRKVDMNSRPDDHAPVEEGGAMKEMHNYLVAMKKSRKNHTPKEQADPVDDQLAAILAKRRERANSVDVMVEKPADVLIDKNPMKKQVSIDSVKDLPVPAPRPKGSIKSKQNKDVSNELAAKLSVALNRIPEDTKIEQGSRNTPSDDGN